MLPLNCEHQRQRIYKAIRGGLRTWKLVKRRSTHDVAVRDLAFRAGPSAMREGVGCLLRTRRDDTDPKFLDVREGLDSALLLLPSVRCDIPFDALHGWGAIHAGNPSNHPNTHAATLTSYDINVRGIPCSGEA